MIYAAILASGSGSRMGANVPKQFIELLGRPIVIRSVDAFLKSGLVDAVTVAVSEGYIPYMTELVEKFYGEEEKIPLKIICGGKNRNETLVNILRSLLPEGGFGEDDVIITHDAVRPFIDGRIIGENIEAARVYGACNTVVPAVDTILRSDDGEFISSVPRRSELFHAQTPQSFKAALLYERYISMTPDELKDYTDACSALMAGGARVRLVAGSTRNIKLTYPEDIETAKRTIELIGE